MRQGERVRLVSARGRSDGQASGQVRTGVYAFRLEGGAVRVMRVVASRRCLRDVASDCLHTPMRRVAGYPREGPGLRVRAEWRDIMLCYMLCYARARETVREGRGVWFPSCARHMTHVLFLPPLVHSQGALCMFRPCTDTPPHPYALRVRASHHANAAEERGVPRGKSENNKIPHTGHTARQE